MFSKHRGMDINMLKYTVATWFLVLQCHTGAKLMIMSIEKHSTENYKYRIFENRKIPPPSLLYKFCLIEMGQFSSVLDLQPT